MRTFDKLRDDITVYLNSLVPDLPVHTREEITVYCVSNFIVREGDVINEINKEWNRRLIKLQNGYDARIKALHKERRK